MVDFTGLSYGRNEEVEEIYRLFAANFDLLMPGPRRLGKTFVLERVVDQAAARGWVAIKVEVAGCTDTRAVFRELCEAISKHKGPAQQALTLLAQRLGQLVAPRAGHTGSWYDPLVSLDYEGLFERLLQAIQSDKQHRWALLIDELPIFLKTLHDRGPEGVAQARDFMNLTSRLRQAAPQVRWLVTGSIGIEPLATAGNYMGVLAKLQPFVLEPLTSLQAMAFVQDLAQQGRLAKRQQITTAEAQALVEEVGWLAAYYLDALAQELRGQPTNDPTQARLLVQDAVNSLLQPERSTRFGTWPEHLRKHWPAADRALAFAVLSSLAPHPQGLSADTLLPAAAQTGLSRPALIKQLQQLHVEGFVTVSSWEAPDTSVAFRNPLLRRWWQRFDPKPIA